MQGRTVMGHCRVWEVGYWPMLHIPPYACRYLEQLAAHSNDHTVRAHNSQAPQEDKCPCAFPTESQAVWQSLHVRVQGAAPCALSPMEQGLDILRNANPKVLANAMFYCGSDTDDASWSTAQMSLPMSTDASRRAWKWDGTLRSCCCLAITNQRVGPHPPKPGPRAVRPIGVGGPQKAHRDPASRSNRPTPDCTVLWSNQSQ